MNSGGISATFALFLVFLVLKLTETIAWSWWWVTAPLWGGTALVLAILLIILIFKGGQELASGFGGNSSKARMRRALKNSK